MPSSPAPASLPLALRGAQTHAAPSRAALSLPLGSAVAATPELIWAFWRSWRWRRVCSASSCSSFFALPFLPAACAVDYGGDEYYFLLVTALRL